MTVLNTLPVSLVFLVLVMFSVMIFGSEWLRRRDPLSRRSSLALTGPRSSPRGLFLGNVGNARLFAARAYFSAIHEGCCHVLVDVLSGAAWIGLGTGILSTGVRAANAGVFGTSTAG